ncbi:MAG: COX15/CtaA family protein [Solirubrobacteraceae bacterium]|nr:COX15/CtaA family protein [Patulibacter sp.]
MRKPGFSPQTAHRLAVASMLLLAFIVFTGAAVRLSGSGLACPAWPECNDQIIHASSPEWIEFGNRLISGAAGLLAVAVFVAMLFRTPRDRTLVWLATFPPIGFCMQGALGAAVVYYDLRPGFVISHFLLSFLILVDACFLVWRSRNPKGERPLATDPLTTWAVRALLPLVTLLVILGTFATGAGPHPGSFEDQVTPRITWFGGDTLHKLILDHGHVGTFTFIVTFLVLVLLWWRKAPKALFNRVLTVWVVFGLQGVIGLIQYYNGLPATLVWVHIVLATCVWVLVLFAVFEAGRLTPRRAAAPAATEPAGTSVA